MSEEVTTYSDSNWAGCKEMEIIKHRRDTDRRSHVESLHTQAQDPCEKQRRGRIVRNSVGSV